MKKCSKILKDFHPNTLKFKIVIVKDVIIYTTHSINFKSTFITIDSELVIIITYAKSIATFGTIFDVKTTNNGVKKVFIPESRGEARNVITLMTLIKFINLTVISDFFIDFK